MASVTMALPIMSATQNRKNQLSSLLKPSKAASLKPKTDMVKVEVFLKEKAAVRGLAAAALAVSMVMPEVAEQHFFLSIAAGGVLLVGILGAVTGVSNFDPVKRV